MIISVNTVFWCFGFLNQQIKTRCNGNNACTFASVSGADFGGDPCQNTYKYLNVTYTCNRIECAWFIALTNEYNFRFHLTVHYFKAHRYHAKGRHYIFYITESEYAFSPFVCYWLGFILCFALCFIFNGKDRGLFKAP